MTIIASSFETLQESLQWGEYDTALTQAKALPDAQRKQLLKEAAVCLHQDYQAENVVRLRAFLGVLALQRWDANGAVVDRNAAKRIHLIDTKTDDAQNRGTQRCNASLISRQNKQVSAAPRGLWLEGDQFGFTPCAKCFALRREAPTELLVEGFDWPVDLEGYQEAITEALSAALEKLTRFKNIKTAMLGKWKEANITFAANLIESQGEKGWAERVSEFEKHIAPLKADDKKFSVHKQAPKGWYESAARIAWEQTFTGVYWRHLKILSRPSVTFMLVTQSSQTLLDPMYVESLRNMIFQLHLDDLMVSQRWKGQDYTPTKRSVATMLLDKRLEPDPNNAQ